MSYERQLENIWLRLQDPDTPQPRHAITTRFAFDGVCAAFIQAEMGPEIDERGKRVWKEKDKMSDDIRTYRAEWNVWAYYYGEQDSFPGLDPALQIQEQEQHHVTSSRQGDYYVPNYAVLSTDRERDMQDIGAALRGSVNNEQSVAVDRGREAIDRRERQAEQFMKYRRHKNSLRRGRKRERERSRITGGEDEGRYLERGEEERREQEAREWMESYGRGVDGYREPTEISGRKEEEYKQPTDDGGHWEGEYQQSADNPGGVEKDEKVSIRRKRMRERQKTKKAAEKLDRKILREQTRQRSMSPTREGGGGEWRGDEFGARDMRDYRDRGYEASNREERGRYEDMEWSGREDARGMDVKPGDHDHRRPIEGRKRGQYRGDERFRDYGRDSGFQSSGWTNKEEPGERVRRDDLIDRSHARQPPALRREDVRRFVEDGGGFDRTSKWVQVGRERVEDEAYRQDFSSYPRYRKTVEPAPEVRRDRSFGVLKDEKEYYREGREGRRNH